MTREKFVSLTPFEQEVFINDGGVIENLLDAPKVEAQGFILSPPSTEVESSSDKEGQVETAVDSGVTTGDKLGGADLSQPALPSSSEPYTQGFDIKDPIELLFLLDDDIASGAVKLHGWQIQFMLDFAHEMHTKDAPFQAEVRACNGSGKDKYIVAACVVWLCMRFSLARGVVTNGSGVQLDAQTETYINLLCERANSKFRTIVWKCNYRYYECLPTKSPITLFATDESNKAEGYHPLVAGAKMAIFASEAKAIPDEIFTALERCTGYTHRVDVSTPGLPMGYFFDTCSTSVDRKQLTDIKSVPSTQPIEYLVTAYDCPHISEQEIERIASRLPGGKNSPVFKSSVLAEFGTTDEMVVIPYTYVYKAFKTPPEWIPESHNKGGLDLSDGGAETCLIVRNGNKHLKTIPFRFDNTEDTIEFLQEKFKENDLNHAEALVFADCCGMGKPMLDSLRRKGWSNIRYVDSRHKARIPRTYLNLGTELFFNIRILLERHELILLFDKDLVRQLSTRYYKITTNNIHQLLSKLEQRSRGYPSPDRADAFNLAFWDYKSNVKYVEPTEETRPFEVPKVKKPITSFNQKQWAFGDTSSPKSRLGKKPDTTYLLEQIDQYNKQLKLNNQ